MHPNRDDRAKTPALDLARQKYSRRLSRLGGRRHPAAALVPAGVLLGLAALILFAPELGIDGLAEPTWRWPLAALAFAAAVWTFGILLIPARR